MTQGNQEQLCRIQHAGRAGANEQGVVCTAIRCGKAKFPSLEQKENPHHCNCSAPRQPLVWPSVRAPYLTTHRSCFLILLQKEFQRMYYHSWGKTESRSAFSLRCYSFSYLVHQGQNSPSFLILSLDQKEKNIFAVCFFSIQPLHTRIQQ